MANHLSLGGSCGGLPLMKFTLRFDGPLGSNKPREKWAIRHQIHPQLADLWQTNHVLRRARNLAIIPDGSAGDGDGSYVTFTQHHTRDSIEPNPSVAVGQIDLFGSIMRHTGRFVPLVRESLALVCELDILFLRKEEPGSLIKQGGDIDNRIKTLFDGLRMPTDAGEFGSSGEVPEPMYCLLEDDSLVTALNVRTDRLLSRPQADVSEVSLVIGVTVKVTHVAQYNMALIGD